MPESLELYDQRACPACGVQALASLWKMESVPPGEQVSFAELADSWRGFFKDRKLFFSYARCDACGQIYAPRYFSPGQLIELYRQMDDNTAGINPATMARTQSGYARQLHRLVPNLPAGGYLELGPDIGLFTKEMLGRGFGHYWMVEPNRAVHSQLKDLLPAKDHTLLADETELDAVPDGGLALVVAIHVIDHVLDPGQLLRQIGRKLRPGGAIFLVLHNQQSVMARVLGRRWPPYCLQHPQIFSPHSISGQLARAGLDRIEVHPTVNYFPVMYLLQHLLFSLGLGRVSLPALLAWTVGLKLGNIAAVARKS